MEVPAKLNLFLHVTGQRSNGYHLLESVFVAIDWCDQLRITVDESEEIQREGDIAWPVQKDLAVRAAEALRGYAHEHGRLGNALGCRIWLQKSIPHGAGLGGGSADAAYTLLLLNRLWGLHYPRDTLQTIGLRLGADLPFFLAEQSAYVRGIGEDITPVTLASRWFVVAVPPVTVPTAAVFQDPLLSRSTSPIGLSAVAGCADTAIWTLGRNDLEPVACRQYPIVARLLESMQSVAEQLGLPRAACRMSGSGGAVFISCSGQEQASAAARLLRALLENTQEGPSESCAGSKIRVCQNLF
nr:4-diphosphocytidyl-2-C-methyl-D-erythritol kinase [Cupriavidus sp.]